MNRTFDFSNQETNRVIKDGSRELLQKYNITESSIAYWNSNRVLFLAEYADNGQGPGQKLNER